MTRTECTDPDLGKLIAHYEMGLLDTADRDRFEEHLLTCAFCAGEVESMYPVAAVMRANREALRRGLAEDGITVNELKKRLITEPSRGRGPRMLSGWRGSVAGMREALRRPAVRWSAVGTVTGLAVLACIVYLIVSPKMPSTGRYVPLLSFQALPYEGSITLRGGESVPGQDEFNAGMQAYLSANYKEAARYLKRAVEMTPDRSEWWLYLGICSYLQHDAKPAIRALGKAEELARGDERIRARWFLSQAYLLQGNRESAEPLLEWIVTQNKDYYKEAFDTLTRLRELGFLNRDQETDPFVVSPQGGEIFLSGSTISIVWDDPQSARTKEYQLWLSSDGGITYPELVAAGIDPRKSVWDWNVGNRAGSRLAIRVAARRDDGTMKNAGSKPFTLSVPPQIDVQSPHRDDRWRRGVTNNVTWINAGTWPLSYTIELYQCLTPDTMLIETIASGLPGTAANWMWTDTSTLEDAREAGAHFRIKVTGQFTGTEVEAWSDGDFFLAPLSVVMVDSFPGGTSSWFEGDKLPTTWQSSESDVLSYSLRLCGSKMDEGTLLVQNLTRETGQWLWNDIGPSGSYLVRVIAHYREGDVSGFSPTWLDIKRGSARDLDRVAILDRPETSGQAARPFSLKQNYPNPFNATTTITFELLEPGPVKLRVFNSLGQTVATLVDGSLGSGQHTVQLDGGQLASGMYLYRLEMQGQVEQKTMVLTK